ncbi:hypothetical protein F5Y03DRAFT_401511 [Xylaria venustula]|nr:hypothetical protein F5Y03DRAFT_401511 [Xylaria venustula]
MQPFLSEKRELGTKEARHIPGFIGLRPAQSILDALHSGRGLRVAREIASEAIHEHSADEFCLRAGHHESGRGGDLVEKQLCDIGELSYAVLGVSQAFPDDTDIEKTYSQKVLLAETASATPGTAPEMSRGRSSSNSKDTKTPPSAHTPYFVYWVVDFMEVRALTTLDFSALWRSGIGDRSARAEGVGSATRPAVLHWTRAAVESPLSSGVPMGLSALRAHTLNRLADGPRPRDESFQED